MAMFPVPPKKKVKKRRKPPIAGPPGRTGPPSARGPKPPLGSGQRFAQLSSRLASKPGVTDPNALAASIGRKKFGAKKFGQLSAKGKPGY